MKAARNIAIILALSAGVYFIPGSHRATRTFEAVLWVAFGVAIAYLGLRLYREYRVALHGLGDRSRAILYGCFALIAFEIVGYDRMVHESRTVFGVIWFALALLVLYGLMDVYRRWRSY